MQKDVAEIWTVSFTLAEGNVESFVIGVAYLANELVTGPVIGSMGRTTDEAIDELCGKLKAHYNAQEKEEKT
jgi:hypothetical protein